MLPDTIHRKIYFYSTLALAIGLPLSPFLVSVSQMVLSLNYISENLYIVLARDRGDRKNFLYPFSVFFLLVKEILLRIIARKSIVFLLSIFFIHIVALLYSTDYAYGLHDIKMKLPLLALPIIYGTSKAFDDAELQWIYKTYLTAAFISVVLGFMIFLGLTPIEMNDIRDVSPIISHIRLSLHIVLSFYLVVYLFITEKSRSVRKNIVHFLGMFCFLVFTLLIGASTGFVIFFLILPIAILFWAKYSGSKQKYYSAIIILILLTGLFSGYLIHSVLRYTHRETVIFSELPKKTLNGNAYQHYENRKEYENSHLIYINICGEEIEREWNKRSQIQFVGKDSKGQNIQSTLFRYMTSLGLTKDSVGIAKLSPADIQMIEKGYTNAIFKNKWSVYPRLYQTYWELEQYFKGGNPSGHSITQRIEYVKNSLRIIRRNFWIGVGTGDVAKVIQQQYEIDKSQIQPQWRFRTHNQFLTFLLTFGIFGLVWIVFALTMALIKEKKQIDFLFVCFFLIFLLSTLNEDTLESQAGASFFAFFISLLLLARLPKQVENKK